MDAIHTVCSSCGAEMKQVGSENGRVRYHCDFCGSNISMEIKAEDNTEYWQKRGALLERVRVGIFESETTRWDYLAKDVTSFVGSYEEAASDARLKMALIACMTSGFQRMNKEQYTKCKVIFKVTERVYKAQMKALEKTMREFPRDEDVGVYGEYRLLYKKCRNEYRNTKFWWKSLFFIVKKLFAFIPI